jgi:hypothetical protein
MFDAFKLKRINRKKKILSTSLVIELYNQRNQRNGAALLSALKEISNCEKSKRING